MDSAAPGRDQPDAALADAGAEACARKKQLLARLDQIGLMALELAGKTQQHAMRATERDLAALDAAPADSPALPAESSGPVLSFARASRIARDCIALELKITDPAAHADDPHKRSAAVRRRLNVMKNEVRHYVERSITKHVASHHVDRLLLELDERLDDADVEAEFGTLTIGQMVLSVCRELDVKPDMTIWPDDMLVTARVAASDGQWQPPPKPAPTRGMARGMAADPTIEKLPTGVIGTPGVPPAMDLPPWSPTKPSAQPPPPDPQANGHASRHVGRDPPAPPRRPPGSFFSR